MHDWRSWCYLVAFVLFGVAELSAAYVHFFKGVDGQTFTEKSTPFLNRFFWLHMGVVLFLIWLLLHFTFIGNNPPILIP